MKQTIKTLSALLLAGTIIFTACKPKTEVEPDAPITTTGTTTGTPTTTAASATPPVNINGSAGNFVAIRSYVASNFLLSGFLVNTEVFSEFALGSVYTNTTSTTLVDAGTINCNDSLLTNSSNSYQFLKKNSDNTSSYTTYFNSGSKWNITGNTGNSVPAFTNTLSAFPNISGFDLGTSVINIPRNAAYTVTFGNISGADSVICQIAGGNSTSIRSGAKAANSNTQHTFTAAQMGNLQVSPNTSGIATGQVSVFAYKYGSKIVSGKTFWFLNIESKTFLVNIQ